MKHPETGKEMTIDEEFEWVLQNGREKMLEQLRQTGKRTVRPKP